MTPDQIVIKEVIENSYEYLEMIEDPAIFIEGVLAKKIVKLNEHIEYLERRLQHVSTI